jgi:hypothetical protein
MATSKGVIQGYTGVAAVDAAHQVTGIRLAPPYQIGHHQRNIVVVRFEAD